MTEAMTLSPHRRLGPAWFMTPATRADRYASALTCDADVALVDLEDSVAADAKDQARRDARAFFAQDGGRCVLGIRVNALSTLDGTKDLAAIAAYPRKPDLILLPKTETARDIALLAAVLGTPAYTPMLFALIETPRAVDRLPEILAAPRLSGAVFGSADYALELGTHTGWEAMRHARHSIANSCAAAGLIAIDTPYFELNDTAGLTAEAHRAKGIGFHGKGAIHPRQLPHITEAFRPTDDEIAEARAIVTAAEHSGDHITSVDGHMRGTPFFTRARRLLAGLDEPQEQQR
ncbi:HpcH/HpaI aldolase/citrate lyase family protein [Kitasatospora sp. NPDC101155]|uniref:HpcH/HpaI aldolase/citrate lyase family protein n=1 Tax=Kitasatospora sp. NPDC101155 TaxID=3364097 RepID=UPI00381E7BA6